MAIISAIYSYQLTLNKYVFHGTVCVWWIFSSSIHVQLGAYFVRKSRRPALQGEEPATADAGIAMGAHPCCPMEPLRRSYRGRRQNHPSWFNQFLNPRWISRKLYLEAFLDLYRNHGIWLDCLMWCLHGMCVMIFLKGRSFIMLCSFNLCVTFWFSYGLKSDILDPNLYP